MIQVNMIETFTYCNLPHTISMVPWNGDWNCGSNNENTRCQTVRDGKLAWSGKYRLYFMGQQEFNENELESSKVLQNGTKAHQWLNFSATIMVCLMFISIFYCYRCCTK